MISSFFNTSLYQHKLKRYWPEQLVRVNPPSFIIVGAQKCGTTSLYSYLVQHPKIIGSKRKEVHFFDDEESFKKGSRYYLEFFKNKRDPFATKISFEASPSYIYTPNVAKRIFEFNRNMKIVIILRDPVDRAFSAWNMYRDIPHNSPKVYRNLLRTGYRSLVEEFYQQEQFPTFESVIEREMERIIQKSSLLEPAIIRRGIYLPQIKEYHKTFGKNRVLILAMGDLKENKVNVLNQVLEFLEIEKSDWNFLNDKIKNSRPYTEKLNANTREFLNDFYEPYNYALFEYLERKLNW